MIQRGTVLARKKGVEKVGRKKRKKRRHAVYIYLKEGDGVGKVARQ